jgi:hypothetical protein
MRRHRRIAAAVPLSLAAVVSAAPAARAHERDFVLSRDWQQAFRGELELESFTAWQPRTKDLAQTFKFEHGISDHVQIEPEVTGVRENGDRFRAESFALETYFNFGTFGYDKLLPSLNVEYERHVQDGVVEDDEADNHVELRGALSWYTHRREDFTVNLTLERGFGGDHFDHEWDGTLSFGYLRPLDFVPGLANSREHPISVGAEFLQNLYHDHNRVLGPVAAMHVTDHLHALASLLFGLNDRGDANPDELRLVLEWEF